MSRAGRSRSSAAAWPAPGSSRSRVALNVASASTRRAFLVGFGRPGAPASAVTSRFMWMPSSPSGAWRPIASVTDGADVAALRDVAGVAEAVHQLRPRLRGAAGIPAELRRLAREAVTGHGRQHEVERVLRVSAVRGRVGEGADGLEQLDHRARPAVGHDQRQRVLVLRLDVDEVDLDPVDLGRELRKRVEPRLEPCRSRSPRPSSARAPASSPAGRPATDRRRAPCSASASPRSAGAGRRSCPLESRSGKAGSRLRSRRCCS